MRSFGMELEWANIDKQVDIPEKLGRWEGNGSHSEVDIINEFDGVFEAAWPNRRWGGEINTAPTSSIDSQVAVLEDLYNLLKHPEHGNGVFVTPISNGHVHVADDEFKDLNALKKLYDFTIRNQDVIIQYWLDLDALPHFKKQVAYHSSAYRYLRTDGGKRVSTNWKEKVHAAKTIDEFQRAMVPHSKSSGKILWARAGRPGINLHSLRHTGTVEFRCMKASIQPEEMRGQLEFANEFVDRVLNDGSDFTLHELSKYKRPPLDPDMLFDQARFLVGLNDWWDTREERKKTGIKVRVGNQIAI